MTPHTIGIALGVALTRFAGAQQPSVRPSAPVGPHAIELHLADRWMHGRQQPRFTASRESDQWLFIDSVRGRTAPSGDGTRTFFLCLDARNSNRRATIVVRG